jgi:hypothetical protein
VLVQPPVADPAGVIADGLECSLCALEAGDGVAVVAIGASGAVSEAERFRGIGQTRHVVGGAVS